MTAPKIKTDSRDSYIVSLLHTILLVCCIVIIALRVVHTESPVPESIQGQSVQIQSTVDEALYSVSVSGVLIFAFLLWLFVALLRKRFSYRATAVEIGLAVFLAVAFLAAFYAPDKRAAINSIVMLLAPILMAVLLAQLLDSPAKIKILLTAVIALGVVAAWQSAEQFFVSNKLMLEHYRQDPGAILQPLGIQPGSINHMMLEHRIQSKDVRASFTTGNSAGSFAILAVFASIAMLAQRLKNRKEFRSPFRGLAPAFFVLAVVLFALFVTRSKGAIAAFFISATIFAILIRVRRPTLSKNIILAAILIAVCAAIPLIAFYGFKFGRLPGGNSMLVRWQYWLASARMFADHPLAGVGPGNFSTVYHQYKPAAAMETVSDPHSFVLMLLTQYGPLGLLGFLLIVLVPLFRESLTDGDFPRSPSGPQSQKLATACIITPSAAILLLNPLLVPWGTATEYYEKLYVFCTNHLAPAAAFIVGSALLTEPPRSGRNAGQSLRSDSLTAIALFCGLLGVLIHNLIDFAIFEPGVLTAYFATLGCLIAVNSRTQQKPPSTFAVPIWLKITVAAVFLIIGFAYLRYVFLPVAESTTKIAQARRPMELGQYELAHNLLADASQDDLLSPLAPSMDGRLYLQHLYSPVMPQQQMLDRSEQQLFTAIERNPVDFKNFESLADLYSFRARLQPEQRNLWLGKAIDSILIAVDLYPASSRLHLQLAEIAEELGKIDMAIKHYEKAIQIEDSFRRQFRMMYPDREVISRMPAEDYLFAKKQLKTLSGL